MTDATKRAARAEALLADPVLQEAFEAVQKAAINDWISTAPTDTAARENAYHRVSAAYSVKAELESFAAADKVRNFNERAQRAAEGFSADKALAQNT